jgi:hypothetical protein
MSRSVDLFIRYDQSIQELATMVGRLMERDLTPGPGVDTWVWQDGEVEVMLREHPYVDDGELLLSSYRFALSASVPNGVRLQDAKATEFLRRVADRLHRSGDIPVLLVLDLQYRDRTPAAKTAPSTSDSPPAESVAMASPDGAAQ